MIVNLFKSYLNDTVIELMGEVSVSSPSTSALSGIPQIFYINYNDVEPRLILQLLDDSGNPIDLTAPPQGVDFSLSCVMAFTTTLENQINSSVNQLTSSYDTRFDTNCILSIDSEVLYVSGITQDHPNNLSILKVQRGSNAAPHYVGAEIRVVRSKPIVSIFDSKVGKIKVVWQQKDTNMPGDYNLEIVLSRTQGASLVRWSIYPIAVTVQENYDLK